MNLKIPIFTYHAANITGNDYGSSDNAALKQDLETLSDYNVNIISAKKLVDYLYGKAKLDSHSKYAVITFDDGNNLDFIDNHYFSFGKQSSFYSVLKQAQQKVHATSFVIASPQARNDMDKTCLGSQNLLSDDWWQNAQDSDIFDIENHTWDHVHPTLEQVRQKDNIKGDFRQINTFDEADAQIRQSSDFIDAKISGKKTSLFAYPYGQSNDYLVKEYFPKQQSSIIAAFTGEPQHVEKDTNVWKIPRYICGYHWKNPEQFRKILSLERHQ